MRGNLRPSTLRTMLEAMGGELEFIARFPGRPPATRPERRKAA